MLAQRSLASSVSSSSRPSRLLRGGRRAAVECRASFFSKLFGGGDDKMGAAASSPSSGNNADNAPAISKKGFPLTMTQEERDAAASKLTPLQRNVILEHGTERPFTGKTVDGTPHDSKKKGVWVSALSGLPLFDSSAKFDSGTGWPSFYAPFSPDHVELRTDRSIPFMPRVEVLDARSGAHLGHVFPDGPAPTGKRFCINAAALRFVADGEPLPLEPVRKANE